LAAWAHRQAKYAASKSGLLGLTKTLAREPAFQLKRAGKLEEDGIGITVNTVAPGFVATEMVAEAVHPARVGIGQVDLALRGLRRLVGVRLWAEPWSVLHPSRLAVVLKGVVAVTLGVKLFLQPLARRRAAVPHVPTDRPPPKPTGRAPGDVRLHATTPRGPGPAITRQEVLGRNQFLLS
jgi:NAD(P)-dependent dehydrogenase (short-subunit alcohol dehydrogenase family)